MGAKFRLRVIQGGKERIVEIDPAKEIFTVGRDEGNTLQIMEGKASREHCQLMLSAGAYKLVDLESSNGTRVNGKPVTSHMLAPGDAIEIGATRLVFEASDGPGAQAPPPAPAGGGLATKESLFLEVLDGDRDRFIEVAADKQVLTVGRSEDNDIVLGEHKASRHHCKLAKEKGELVLYDLNSANGTRIRGQKVATQILRWGDVIEIGQARIVVGERKKGEDPEALGETGDEAAGGGGGGPAGFVSSGDGPVMKKEKAPDAPEDASSAKEASAAAGEAGGAPGEPAGAGAEGVAPAGEADGETLALTVTDSSGTWRHVVKKDQKVVTVGRTEENDLHVKDTEVSRHHCRLELTERGWRIEDLGSSNGTRVNGEEVAARPLNFLDVVEIGDSKFVFGDQAYARKHRPAGTGPGSRWRRLTSPTVVGAAAGVVILALVAAWYFNLTPDLSGLIGRPTKVEEVKESAAKRALDEIARVGNTGRLLDALDDYLDKFARDASFPDESEPARAERREQARRAEKMRDSARQALRENFQATLAAARDQARREITSNEFEKAMRAWEKFGKESASLAGQYQKVEIDAQKAIVQERAGVETAAREYCDGKVGEAARLTEGEAPRFEEARLTLSETLDRLLGTPSAGAVSAALDDLLRRRDAWRDALVRKAHERLEKERAEAAAAEAAAKPTEGAGVAPPSVTGGETAAAPPAAGVSGPAATPPDGEGEGVPAPAPATTATVASASDAAGGYDAARVQAAEAMARILRYDRALEAYDAEMAKLDPASDLRKGLAARREEIALMRALFDNLRADVNAGLLKEGFVVFNGKPSRADEQSLFVKMEGFDVPKRWSAIAAPDMVALFQAMPRRDPNYYWGLAHYACASPETRGAGEAALMALYLGDQGNAEQKDRIDAAIARYRGIAKPKKGFFVYQNKVWLLASELAGTKDLDAIDAAVKEFKKGFTKPAQSEAKAASDRAFFKLRDITERHAGKESFDSVRREVVEHLIREHDAAQKRLAASPGARELNDLKKELNRRRDEARALIFDKDKYPYPYRDNPDLQKKHDKQQKLIDEAVARVREIWDNPGRFTSKAMADKAQPSVDIMRDANYKLQDIDPAEAYWSREAFKHVKYDQLLDGLMDIRSHYATANEERMIKESRKVVAENAAWQGETVGDKNVTLTREERAAIRDANEYRMMMSRRALSVNAKLVLAARNHSDHMKASGKFAHDIPGHPNGETPTLRARDVHYDGAVGENITMSDAGHTGESALFAWLHSSGHHRNILEDGWKAVGVGHSKGLTHFTQMFGVNE
ncbi:MAG: FHA domain-containing protein [Planctomycetes bacterium]|nr:FHA domain-containing protein [Planctomycetota bacterium]